MLNCLIKIIQFILVNTMIIFLYKYHIYFSLFPQENMRIFRYTEKIQR